MEEILESAVDLARRMAGSFFRNGGGEPSDFYSAAMYAVGKNWESATVHPSPLKYLALCIKGELHRCLHRAPIVHCAPETARKVQISIVPIDSIGLEELGCCEQHPDLCSDILSDLGCTEEEIRIALLKSIGYTYREIGNILSVTPSTVARRMEKIKGKCYGIL